MEKRALIKVSRLGCAGEKDVLNITINQPESDTSIRVEIPLEDVGLFVTGNPVFGSIERFCIEGDNKVGL